MQKLKETISEIPSFFFWTGRMNRISFLIHYFIVRTFLIFVRMITETRFEGGIHFYDPTGYVLIMLGAYRMMILTVRRAHDCGVSAYVVLACIAMSMAFHKTDLSSMIEYMLLIVVLLCPGEKRDNQYGRVPGNFTWKSLLE